MPSMMQVVEERWEMGMNNKIHSTAKIGPDVQLGKGVEIGPYSVIGGYTIIGDETKISSHVVIGTNAEHRKFFDQKGHVEIGKNCRIREFVTVNAGTQSRTVIEKNCILLRGSHVGHDSHIEENVTLSCNVLVGGESHVMKHANLGLGAILHQFSLIGSWSMLGMGTVVTKHSNICPARVYVGSPAYNIKMNRHLLDQLNVQSEEFEHEIDRFFKLGGKP